jgi:hypothetical protein
MPYLSDSGDEDPMLKDEVDIGLQDSDEDGIDASKSLKSEGEEADVDDVLDGIDLLQSEQEDNYD